MGIKDIAKRMAAAKVSGGGTYIQDCSGVLILKTAEYKPDAGTSKKDEIGVFEFKVESSTEGSADKFCVDGGEGNKSWKAKPLSPPNKPGSSCSFLCEFTTNEEVAFSKLKGLMLALLDETEETLAAEAARRNGLPAEFPKAKDAKDAEIPHDGEAVLAQLYELACTKEQPLRGTRVAFTTYRTLTKAGNVITVPKFEPVKNQTAEQVAAERAKLDGEKPPAAAAS